MREKGILNQKKKEIEEEVIDSKKTCFGCFYQKAATHGKTHLLLSSRLHAGIGSISLTSPSLILPVGKKVCCRIGHLRHIYKRQNLDRKGF